MTHGACLGQIGLCDFLFRNPSYHMFPRLDRVIDNIERIKRRRGTDMRARGNRPWHLMSFHKAADVPSNSINSLAPTE